MTAVQTSHAPASLSPASPVPEHGGSETGAVPAAGACDRLLQRFGGVRPMASKLEIPVTTVQGWKRRGTIPASRADELRAAARSHGITLDEAELTAVLRSEDRGGEGAGGAEAESSGAAPGVLSSPSASGPFSPAPFSSAAAPPRLFERPLSTRHAAAPALRFSAGNSLGPVRLAVAAAGVAVLAAIVAVVGMGGAPLDGVPMPASGLERRVSDLEGRIARTTLEQSATATALDRVSLDLGGRVAVVELGLPALERRIAAQGVGSPALGALLAAGQLRNALATAGPFQNELSALRLAGLGAGDSAFRQDLDRIANRASTGIATEAWLVGRFSLVAADISRAAHYNSTFGRMADGLYDFLAAWAPPLYRLTGTENGTSPRAMAERAQAWMATGNFSRAVEQLEELTGLPTEAAAPWLAEARARVIADRLRTQLDRLAAAVPSPGAPPAGK